MNSLRAVYTDKTNCQDCFKCIRQCTVKAIAMAGGHAQIIAESCTHCGHCVLVCPVGAKRIRNDLTQVKEALAGPIPVYLSLAPSWLGEFSETAPAQLIAQAKAAGFAGVSETALGAEEIIHHLKSILKARPGIHISSACPAVVALIQKHHPGLVQFLTPVLSPLLAHAKMLQSAGPCQVVFAGPCAAKKEESDQFPQLVAAALTFTELRELIKPFSGNQASAEDVYFPRAAGAGALFPRAGGMNLSFQCLSAPTGLVHLNYAGMDQVRSVLMDLEADPPRGNVFLELLACEGGCLAGPGMTEKCQNLVAREVGLDSCRNLPAHPMGTLDLHHPWGSKAESPLTEVRPWEDIWKELGKEDPREELNCGGCGYETCRELATGVSLGRAEISMCISRNRKLAQKKLNTLVGVLPSALVIADGNLRILESNPPFARMAGQEFLDLREFCPGLEGLCLEEVLPFHQAFREVLDTGKDQLEKQYIWGQRTLQGSIFTIEAGAAVGGIFQDVTTEAMQRTKVMSHTRTVIQKNLETVQKIAFLLGENAAETEGLLNSLLAAFGKES